MNQRAALQDTLAKLRANGMATCEIEEEGCDFDHFVDMHNRILAADHNGTPFSEAKLGRWLGWIQGAASACGFLTLDEAKHINQRWSD